MGGTHKVHHTRKKPRQRSLHRMKLLTKIFIHEMHMFETPWRMALNGELYGENETVRPHYVSELAILIGVK